MSGELTKEEKAAISALRRLAKRWPQSLGLLSMSGALHVTRMDPDGGFSHLPGRGSGHDSDAVIETIYGIPNDGGDW